jgi:hypothetical protein
MEADLERAIGMSIPYWDAIEPGAVEEGYTLHWRGAAGVLPMHGFIDVVDTAASDWDAVVDLKTGRAKKPEDVLFDPAIMFYGAVRSRIGSRPLRKRRYLVYKKTKVRAVEIVEGPDFPEGGVSVERLHTISVTLTEALAQGIYPPIPDAQDCTRCAFRGPCDETFGVAA